MSAVNPIKATNDKAIVLLSGGLDSLLAAKVLEAQGIKVIGLTCVMQFASRNIREFSEKVACLAADAGIEHRAIDISEQFLEVLTDPCHGYGANLNPCIDCKILMLRQAKKVMEEEGALFVATGEVLGERPMSQKKDSLLRIEEKSGLKGYLLRPLSAKLLEETIPEKKGTVDRNRLYGLQGRSRSGQYELAKRYGLKKFFAPAGGCLLTDPIFSVKLRDLMEHGELTMDNVSLLKHGRHFRLDRRTKVVVGRDEKDNQAMTFLKKGTDVLMRMKNVPGPDVIVRGDTTEKNIDNAGKIAMRYSKAKGKGSEAIEYWTDDGGKRLAKAGAISEEMLESFRI